MKRLVGSALIALLTGMGTARAETRVGVLAGFGLTRMEQTRSGLFYTFDDRFLPGVTAGAVVEWRGAARLGLRTEPLYSLKGSRYQDPACPCLRPVGYVPKDNDLRLSYLELPVLLTLSLGQGAWRPYVLAGPTAGFLAGGHVTRDGVETGIRDEFKKWDLGYSLGGGVRHRPGRFAPFLEARYTGGLVHVDESSRRNQAVQVWVGMTVATRGPSGP